jgi:polyisoprenoid-binding protein YceI
MSYTIDFGHSLVSFTARHMMISKVRGEFQSFSGTVNLDEQNPELTTVDITIDTASVSTRDANRDGHLKSADFFNAAEYPTMTFKSAKVVRTGDNTAKLHGDLTIRDVTKPVVLDVEYAGSSKSPWGTTAFGFNASTKIGVSPGMWASRPAASWWARRSRSTSSWNWSSRNSRSLQRWPDPNAACLALLPAAAPER